MHRINKIISALVLMSGLACGLAPVKVADIKGNPERFENKQVTKPYTTTAGGGETDATGSGNRWDWTLGQTQFNWLAVDPGRQFGEVQVRLCAPDRGRQRHDDPRQPGELRAWRRGFSQLCGVGRQ